MRWTWIVLFGMGLAGCDAVQAWLDPSPPETIYVVVRGDTLGKIAKAHGVTVDQLRSWNGIRGDLIEVGQPIRILAADAPAAAPPRAPGRRPSTSTKVRDRTRAAPEERSGSPLARSMPAAKPCLAGPDLGEAEMVASEGLAPGQIRTVMNGELQHVVRCVSEVPSGTAQLGFTVGCDGRVAKVHFAHDPGWPDDVRSCILGTLKTASFPPHALPDGDTFTVPLGFD